MRTAQAHPTARQREYLAFIKAFTDRWGIPPSFEEIGRHFGTTPPSVNNMVKTLEARGFLSRVPGAARTLRVLVPEAELGAPAASRPAPVGAAPAIEAAIQLASVVMERLVPVLKGGDREVLAGAFDAIAEALEVTLRGAGASEEQRRGARDTLLRVASLAQGINPEVRPGRRVPWWQRPRRR